MTLAEFEAALRARGIIACNIKLRVGGAAILTRRQGETEWSAVTHGRSIAESAEASLRDVQESDIDDLV